MADTTALPEERYIAQAPVEYPLPARPVLPPKVCGECPNWKMMHRTLPFGQCLLAQRALGATMYTPDLAACSLDDEAKANGAQRRI